MAHHCPPVQALPPCWPARLSCCRPPCPPPPPPPPPAHAGISTLLASPPELLDDSPGLRLWHKLDQRFATPRTNAYLRISMDRAHESVRVAALTHVWLKVGAAAAAAAGVECGEAGLCWGWRAGRGQVLGPWPPQIRCLTPRL
jgi:hypothetical protein